MLCICDLACLLTGSCAVQADMQGLQDSLCVPPVLRPGEQTALSPAALGHAASAVLPRQQSAEPGGGGPGPVAPADSRPQLWLSRVALRRLSAVDPAAAVLQERADAHEQDTLPASRCRWKV